MQQQYKCGITTAKESEKMKRKLKKGTKEPLKNAVQLCENFGTSWKVQTKMFFEHSTLHGVRYIAEKDRPFLEKFMWFACVAIGAVATTVIIVSLWDKFQTNPTITGLDTDFHNWKVPFPAITVCQEIPYNLDRIEQYFETKFSNASLGFSVELLTQLTELSFDSIKDFKYEVKTKTPDNFDLKNITFELMNRCDEIFEKCEFKSNPINCCEAFLPVFTEKGFCYVFNSRHYEKSVPWSDKKFPPFEMRYIKETDLKWSLTFRLQNITTISMPIYILNSDEQAGLDIQPQHIWDYKVNTISFSVKQTYTTEDTRQLSIKQRHCVFSNELQLETDNIYTYTACTRQCRMDNSMRICKCVPHFYPQTSHYRHCSLHQLSCISENVNTIKAVDRCSCHLGCSNTVYEVEKLTEASNDAMYEMQARFVSWPMVRYKREVLFGWVDLLVSFGGIAGLFLGFSLLSGVEILYYFTMRACCMLVREKPELEQIQYEEISKVPEDYDLSLLPYCCFDPFPGNGINEVAKGYYKENLYNNRSRNPNVNPFSKKM